MPELSLVDLIRCFLRSRSFAGFVSSVKPLYHTILTIYLLYLLYRGNLLPVFSYGHCILHNDGLRRRHGGAAEVQTDGSERAKETRNPA